MYPGSSVEYALIVMGYIGEHPDGQRISSLKIAEECNLPEIHLRLVMNQLYCAGFLQSKRGRYGGFFLAKPAREISMFEIIEAVNGPGQDYYAIDEQAKRQPFIKKMDAVCDKAANQAIVILKKAKLSEMVG